MTSIVKSSIEYFADPTKGRPVANGKLYVGIIDLDPEIPANQKQISIIQENGTPVQVAQPLSLSSGGVPVYNNSPATVTVTGDYSLKIVDKNDAQVYYIPNISTNEQDVPIVINTMSVLRTTEGTFSNQISILLGYNTIGDNGNGHFYWDSTSTETDNSGTIIKVTGVDTGRWKRLQAEDSLNADWFGADSTGVLDSSSALTSALSLGKVVSLTSSGTYLVNSAVTTSNNYQHIEGNGATIDGTGSTDLIFLDLGGSVGASAALTTSITEGDTSIVTSLSGLEENDIILIRSTDPFEGATGLKGELAEVKSVSGTTITLMKRTYDGYTNSTTTIEKINAPKVIVKNLKIVRSSNVAMGIHIQYARDIEVKNCDVTGCRYTCIDIRYVYGGLMTNNYTSDGWYSGTTNSYGIALSDSQMIDVISNRLFDARHGITHGGTYVVRDVKIIDNYVDNTRALAAGHALDFHTNAEYVLIDGNTVYNTMYVACKNITLTNNLVWATDSGRGGIAIFTIGSSDYIDIIGNKVYCDETSSSGISIRPSTVGATIDRLSILNNYVNATLYAVNVTPFDASQTGITINDLNISDNKLVTTPASPSNASAINVDATSSVYITIPKATIRGNYLFGSQIGAKIGVDSDSGSINFEGNDINSDGSCTGLYVASAGIDCFNIVVSKNTFNTTAGMFIKANNDIIITNNFINNADADRGVLAIAIGSIFIDNNSFFGCIGTLNLSASNIVDRQGISATMFLPAVPSAAGTYRLGDVINNSNPSAGQPAGWTCSFSGTFGSATDSTGDTDGSTATITGMTDTSDFFVGDFLQVSSGFPSTGPYELLRKTSTSVTIDTNSNSVASNITVAQTSPLFLPHQNL